jgi:hypothetical protein
VRLLGQTVALADSKLTHGWAGGQLIFPEVIMSRLLSEMHMNERFAKWNRWLDIIYDQVTDLAVYRHIFWEVQSIIKNNQRILLPNPLSAAMCVSHMPSLKAKKLRKLSQEKVLLEL